MAEQIVPTKGNLMNVKKSLDLARIGFDLMDKKRNILIRETMSLMNVVSGIQAMINTTFSEAYAALQMANITLGIIDDLAQTVPVENGIGLRYRSVMGVEIPTVDFDPIPTANYYGYSRTNAQLDEAYDKFDKVKKLVARLGEIETSVIRLAEGIKKTQKRANALKNIIIPRFEESVSYITSALDEKDREEFSRLKVIKKHIS